MQHHLRVETTVRQPIDDVFKFFSNAANLEALTPSALHFEILTPGPIVIAEGTLIDYRLRLLGVPFRWKTRIAAWEPPYRFVDEQLVGPYAEWVHEHTFEPTPDGTRVRDHVRYRLPLEPIGDLAYPIVRAQLHYIFGYRTRALHRLLPPTTGPVPTVSAR
jgi:ligand-binding SRPBCC domain-containing protein